MFYRIKTSFPNFFQDHIRPLAPTSAHTEFLLESTLSSSFMSYYLPLCFSHHLQSVLPIFSTCSISTSPLKSSSHVDSSLKPPSLPGLQWSSPVSLSSLL